MTPQQPNEIWTIRTACFGLALGLAAIFIGAVLVFILGMVSFGRDSFDVFRHSQAGRLTSYLSPRVLMLAVCLYLTGISAWTDFARRFALRRPSPKPVVLAAILGVWVATFLEFAHPGRLSNLRLQTPLLLGNCVLLIAPFFDEAIIRGFFYPAFRGSLSVAGSIVFVGAIDTLLFHFGKLGSFEALVGVGVVNVITCLLRERTSSLWPCITFHVAFNILYAFFKW